MSRQPLLNGSAQLSYTTAAVSELSIKDETLDIDELSVSSESDLPLTSTIGYVPELKWTAEEEDAVRNKIDLRLMSFVLLMTFVLNMDRTNICKYRLSFPTFHIANAPPQY
jgi:hypothetical protein